MTKELVEVIDKNGVRTRRWKNVGAADSDHSLLSKLSALPSTTREERVKDDFIQSECWVLAKYLHEQNPERYKIAMLGDEEGGWVHAFVKDTSRDDTYIDIEGEHSADEMLIDWDWNPDWDAIIDGDVSAFDGMKPDKSRSSLDDALDVLKSDGIEIESRIKPPETVFHVTTKRNLDSILREGLRPYVGPRSEKLNELSAVFVFDSQESANDGVASWLGEEFDDDEELVLLSVDTHELDINPSFEDGEDSFEWSTQQTIHPSRVSVVADANL